MEKLTTCLSKTVILLFGLIQQLVSTHVMGAGVLCVPRDAEATPQGGPWTVSCFGKSTVVGKRCPRGWRTVLTRKAIEWFGRMEYWRPRVGRKWAVFILEEEVCERKFKSLPAQLCVCW